MFSKEEVLARIKASMEIGTADFIARGGFSATQFFYLSFADSSLPKGKQWLGGCYIRSESFDEAMVLSKVLGINPGGQVQFVGPVDTSALKLEYENRLLTSAEAINAAYNPARNSVFKH